jgi:hypothetical protein
VIKRTKTITTPIIRNGIIFLLFVFFEKLMFFD